MNWAVGERQDIVCDMIGRIGGRQVYFLGIFGKP